MQQSLLGKILVVVGVFLFLCLNLAGIDAQTTYVKYVEVSLQNGGVERLDYDTFTFSWILPITITEPVACDATELAKENIAEIYMVGEFSNGCANKDDYEVKVYLTDNSVKLGFFNVSEFTVKGHKYNSGEEVSFPFKDIKKVIFKR